MLPYLIAVAVILFAISYYRLVFAVDIHGKWLAGLNVLVTGAGNGIGKALCLALAREGCNVICVDIETESNNKTKDDVLEITNNGVKAGAFTCDLSKYENVQQLAENVYKQFEHVDILVNNAGVGLVGNFLDFSENGLKKIVDINLMSQFWTIKEFLPDMLKRNSGHIVSTSSCMAQVQAGGLAAYCATKCGLIGFMNAIDQEIKVVHSNANVKISTVLPFFVNTRLNKQESAENRFNKLFLISPEKAASDYVAGIKLELPWFTLPRQWSFVFSLVRCLPSFVEDALLQFITARMLEGAAFKPE